MPHIVRGTCLHWFVFFRNVEFNFIDNNSASLPPFNECDDSGILIVRWTSFAEIITTWQEPLIILVILFLAKLWITLKPINKSLSDISLYSLSRIYDSKIFYSVMYSVPLIMLIATMIYITQYSSDECEADLTFVSYTERSNSTEDSSDNVLTFGLGASDNPPPSSPPGCKTYPTPDLRLSLKVLAQQFSLILFPLFMVILSATVLILFRFSWLKNTHLIVQNIQGSTNSSFGASNEAPLLADEAELSDDSDESDESDAAGDAGAGDAGDASDASDASDDGTGQADHSSGNGAASDGNVLRVTPRGHSCAMRSALYLATENPAFLLEETDPINNEIIVFLTKLFLDEDKYNELISNFCISREGVSLGENDKVSTTYGGWNRYIYKLINEMTGEEPRIQGLVPIELIKAYFFLYLRDKYSRLLFINPETRFLYSGIDALILSDDLAKPEAKISYNGSHFEVFIGYVSTFPCQTPSIARSRSSFELKSKEDALRRHRSFEDLRKYDQLVMSRPIIPTRRAQEVRCSQAVWLAQAVEDAKTPPSRTSRSLSLEPARTSACISKAQGSSLGTQGSSPEAQVNSSATQGSSSESSGQRSACCQAALNRAQQGRMSDKPSGPLP